MKDAGLRDLEAVLAIARRGTFRAAAIELGMSTTALSHAIARLEAGLGVRLFNRTTRSVSLSDAGRQFVFAALCHKSSKRRHRCAATQRDPLRCREANCVTR